MSTLGEAVACLIVSLIVFSFALGIFPHPIRFHREGMERVRRNS